MLSDYRIGLTIPATDLARAKKFYTQTLGFEPIEEQAEGIIFVSGDVEFTIYPTRAKVGSATVAGWAVPDLEAEMKDLRDRGVTFEEYDLPGIKTIDGVAKGGGLPGGVAMCGPHAARLAWFKDSEGNVLVVEERA